MRGLKESQNYNKIAAYLLGFLQLFAMAGPFFLILGGLLL